MVLDIFTYADIVFVVLALIAFIAGLSKGFVGQIFGILGTAASLIVAFVVTKPLEEAIRPVFQGIYNSIANDTISHIVSIVIVFAAVALIVKLLLSLIQRLLSALTEKLHLIRALDKMLGMFLSLAIVYSVFAVLIGLLNIAPDGFLVSVQETLKSQIYGGVVLKALFASNPLGDWLSGMLFTK